MTHVEREECVLVVSEQPGRWAAVVCVAPLLTYCGIRVLNSFPVVGILLICFAAVFFVYEIFWLCSSQPPKTATVATPSIERIVTFMRTPPRPYSNAKI